MGNSVTEAVMEGDEKMKMRSIVLTLTLALVLAGCAGFSSREQRMLSGGAIGAGVGTAGAAILAGPLIVGAAAGAAAGVVGGLIVEELQNRE
jgi:osmotically inducible lipoprotein OsmB